MSTGPRRISTSPRESLVWSWRSLGYLGLQISCGFLSDHEAVLLQGGDALDEAPVRTQENLQRSSLDSKSECEAVNLEILRLWSSKKPSGQGSYFDSVTLGTLVTLGLLQVLHFLKTCQNETNQQKCVAPRCL